MYLPPALFALFSVKVCFPALWYSLKSVPQLLHT